MARFSVGPERVPVQVSGNAGSGRCLLFSTGFAGSRTDYGALCRLFEPEHLVVRIAHPGSARAAGLQALGFFLWYRLRGLDGLEAARKVRAWLHRPENCQRRLAQLLDVAEEIGRRYEIERFSLAGHSFGTDTVLRGALQMDVEELFLFSPHAPGYLIPMDRYSQLRAGKICLVTGTKDWTRDGVSPEARLKVADVCPARIVMLEGVRHMDFAFAELGPEGWVESLAGFIGCS